MVISEQQRKSIDSYIRALEKFCAYSINEEIGTFWAIAKKPSLILKWRERTATKLYKREECSLGHCLVNQKPGTVLQTSVFFR